MQQDVAQLADISSLKQFGWRVLSILFYAFRPPIRAVSKPWLVLVHASAHILASLHLQEVWWTEQHRALQIQP